MPALSSSVRIDTSSISVLCLAAAYSPPAAAYMAFLCIPESGMLTSRQIDRALCCLEPLSRMFVASHFRTKAISFFLQGLME
jgi:hypothetical protein